MEGPDSTIQHHGYHRLSPWRTEQIIDGRTRVATKGINSTLHFEKKKVLLTCLLLRKTGELLQQYSTRSRGNDTPHSCFFFHNFALHCVRTKDKRGGLFILVFGFASFWAKFKAQASLFTKYVVQSTSFPSRTTRRTQTRKV